MSDQNTILPDILTDETKIFILSAVTVSFLFGLFDWELSERTFHFFKITGISQI